MFWSSTEFSEFFLVFDVLIFVLLTFSPYFICLSKLLKLIYELKHVCVYRLNFCTSHRNIFFSQQSHKNDNHKKCFCQKNQFFFQFKNFLTFLSKLTCGINQNNEIHKINEFIKNKELGSRKCAQVENPGEIIIDVFRKSKILNHFYAVP